MANRGAVTREYFDNIYRARDDPWSYESSDYEAKKYQASLQALTRERYGNVLEIGCSIGVFTARLAPRCAKLLSLDVAKAALEKAKSRCALFPHVRFEQMFVPAEYPADIFDLTILSEVGYYLSAVDLAKLSEQIIVHTAGGGQLLLVDWLAPVEGYALRGDDVHEHFLSRPEWRVLSRSRTDLYRLDLLEAHFS